MADVLAGFTFDIAFALHAACVEIKTRIDAAKNLPQTAQRCVRLVDQIEGMIDGCNAEDRRTRVILENIQACMKELGDLVDKLERAGGTKGGGVCICFTLASRGKDVLDAEAELERVEEELRKHIESLVQATQLHAHTTRKSNKLKQADARRFWDENFGDQREVSVAALAEALRFECRDKEIAIDFDAVLPICRACFSGTETVTVLHFGEVFSLASVSETMASLSKRASAASHLFPLKVYEYATKSPDKGIDAGFLMCRATDCLHVLRSLIMKHALTLGEADDSVDGSEFDFDDEDGGKGVTEKGEGANGGSEAAGTAGEKEAPVDRATGGVNDAEASRAAQLAAVPPEFKFLAEGSFTFFLDGCDVRVRRKQERGMEGLDYISRACIVRNEDLPDSLKPAPRRSKSRRARLSRSGSKDGDDTALETGSQGTSVDDEEDATEDAAEAMMARAQATLAAAQCKDVAAAVKVPTLHQGLRLAAVRTGVPEEAVAFLIEVEQLKQAASAISPAAAGALSKPRLRLVTSSCTNIADRFLNPTSKYKLPASPETLRDAAETIDSAAAQAEAPEPVPGLDAAMLDALEAPAAEVMEALGPALEILAKKQQNMNRVVMTRKKGAGETPGRNSGDGDGKHRVVVLGGGFAGSLIAYNLDTDPSGRFHVTLVDPKHFFEDVMQLPMTISNPGLSPDDPDGNFSKTWVGYNKVVPNGRKVAGLVTSISDAFVEIGSDRSVIPFDSLVVATGSSYTSDVKVMNPSVDYRCRQLQAELAVLKAVDTVLIIGGGLVGVEISSNIADRLKIKESGKKVVLVQNGPYLLPRVVGAHDRVLPYLTKLGIEVRCNERVVEMNHLTRTYVTNKGTRLTAGKVYECTGAKPNTAAFADPRSHPLIRASLDDRGYVKVDKHCRIEGLPHVYAAGDILFDPMFANTGKHAVTGKKLPERIGQAAELHSLIVTKNIRRALDDEPLVSMNRDNDPFGQTSCVSMGTQSGLVVCNAQLNQLYKGMGFDLGAKDEDLEENGCGLSPTLPGFKDYITSLFIGGISTPETHAEVMGMTEMNPMQVDPLKPPQVQASEPESAVGVEPEAPEAAHAAAPVDPAVFTNGTVEDEETPTLPERATPPSASPSPAVAASAPVAAPVDVAASAAMADESAASAAEIHESRQRAARAETMLSAQRQRADDAEVELERQRARAEAAEAQRARLRSAVDAQQARADDAEVAMENLRRELDAVKKQLVDQQRQQAQTVAAVHTPGMFPVHSPRASASLGGSMVSVSNVEMSEPEMFGAAFGAAMRSYMSVGGAPSARSAASISSGM